MANLERDLFKFIIRDIATAWGIYAPHGSTAIKTYSDSAQNLIYPYMKYGLDLELMEATGLYPPGTVSFTPSNIETCPIPAVSLANDPIVLKWRCYNIEKIKPHLL